MAGRISYYGGIVLDGLVLNLDAAKIDSYRKTGTLWTDISLNGNNGTLTNGPTFNSGNGGNIQFDGSNDYVQVANNTSLNSATGSVSVWFKYQTITGANGFSLIGKHTSSGSLNGYNLIVSSGAQIWAQIKGSSNPIVTTASNSGVISVDTWTNAVLTYSSGVSHAIYVNNATTSSGGCISFTMTTQPIRMVDSIDSFWGIMAGNIAIVQIYNRVLSASEVSQNYNAQKGRFGL